MNAPDNDTEPAVSVSTAGSFEEAKLLALAEFAAGAGHEMNNPLAVISGRAQYLMQQGLPESVCRDLAQIHAQARRVHEMIADLMLFARPPSPVKQANRLADIVDQAIQETQAEFSQRAESIDWEKEAPTSETLQLDLGQVLGAVKAVLRNALAACPDGGRVIVTLTELDQASEIAVCNPDVVLTEEVAVHLFDPFYSGRPAGRGLGLGLCKAWRVMQMHAGHLSVESRAETGTIVTLHFPRSQTDDARGNA